MAETTPQTEAQGMSNFQLVNNMLWRLQRLNSRGGVVDTEPVLRGVLEPERIFELPYYLENAALVDDYLKEFYQRTIRAAVERYGLEIIPVEAATTNNG